MNMQVANEGLIPAGKREPGHGRCHADIDSNHARMEMLIESSGGIPVARKNRGAVSVGTIATQLNDTVQIVSANDR